LVARIAKRFIATLMSDIGHHVRSFGRAMRRTQLFSRQTAVDVGFVHAGLFGGGRLTFPP
jgi:hypothetical protein